MKSIKVIWWKRMINNKNIMSKRKIIMKVMMMQKMRMRMRM